MVTVAVPKERAPGERRVALVPEVVARLVKGGARVRVEGAWLLVDDVLTSGATFLRARGALLEAGAAHVYGAFLAVRDPRALGPYR